MSSKLKSLIGLIAGLVISVAVDQLTKIAAVSRLADGPHILIDGVLELRYLENHGAAFGVFQGAQTFFLIVTAIFLAAALFVYLKIPAGKRFIPLKLTLILMISGAIGNLLDRVRFSYVRDFIYFSLIDFPIFNVADICVTTSAFLLAFLILFYYKDEDLAFLSLTRTRGQNEK